jgi:hypothetical protein
VTRREKIHYLIWSLVVIVLTYLTTPSRQQKSPSGTSVAVPFSLLAETTRNEESLPRYPAHLLALDDHRVTISGFATPYDDPQIASKLLLAASGGSCYFCAPPRVNGVVLVRRISKSPLPLWKNQQLTFEGMLHLVHADTKDEEARQFFFTLDEASMVRNSG